MKFQFHPIVDFLGGPLLGGVCLFLLGRELVSPLRKCTEDKADRLQINAGIAATAAVTMRLALVPVVYRVATQVEKRQWGLVNCLPLPRPLKVAAAFLLLDYSMYAWHVLTHKVPLLWRFHNVHHSDLDMDVSTAFRFHFGELLLSVLYRSAQVSLIGVGPQEALAYEVIFEAETEFHHSNWRLPLGVERVLSHFLVTPRMHGIHHSIVEGETNSNWSNILPLWDYLHGTARLDVPQDAITIGVPQYRDPLDLTFLGLLLLPFTRQRLAWELPDGTVPTREPGLSQEGAFPQD